MSFFNQHTGEFAALLTAFFWTITSLAFESASYKIGSIAVNILRLVIGFAFLSVFTLIRRGFILPVDASYENWIWLSLSGLVGFVFGDLFLFKSYTMIGSRFSMLIMTLVPPITAFFSFLILGERLTLYHYLGVRRRLAGIRRANRSRSRKGENLALQLAPKAILKA